MTLPAPASVSLRGLYGHRDTTVRLPPTGIVLVTGENGAGKSALIEAVAFAVWGQTLRGTPPWDNPDGSVRVEFVDGLVVERFAKAPKGKLRLAWSAPDVEPVEFATVTKAEEALAARVGSFASWRRSCVFSSSDAALFSLATDGERKRVFEEALGLDRFDPALARVRPDLRAALASVSEASGVVATLQASLKRAEADLVAAQTDAGPRPPDPDPAPLARLQGLVAEARSRLVALMHEHNRVDDKRRLAEAGVRLAEAVRLSPDVCPACSQPVPRERLDALAADKARRVAEAQATLASAVEAVRPVADEVAEARENLDRLAAKEQRARDALTAAKADLATWERLSSGVSRAEVAVSEARAALDGAVAKVAEHKRRADLLTVVERVLGLRGVRASLLRDAAAGLEAVANAWLARLFTRDVQLTLGGDTTDKLDIGLSGVGGGHGYSACSNGERRRVDVALLFALGEFAGAGGTSSGLLVLDEVLDALDKVGLERVCAEVQALAESRPVFVVSHLDELVSALRPAQRLRVSAGAVSVA